jgi:hypothetical protein
MDADIDRLSAMEWNPEYNEYASGDWSTLALFNRDGVAGSSKSHEFSGKGRWTSNADKLPAIRSAIETVFDMEKLRSARVFSAGSAGMIRPHRDYTEFDRGFTRLHLVLRTNEQAMNGEGVRAFHMGAGDIWYLDAREPHWAANFGLESRYHLCCDFPPDMEPQGCITGHVLPSVPVAELARPPLDDSISGLLRIAVQSVEREALPELLDIVDRLYVRYDCQYGTPYDVVLTQLGARDEIIRAVIDRRSYFYGF